METLNSIAIVLLLFFLFFFFVALINIIYGYVIDYKKAKRCMIAMKNIKEKQQLEIEEYREQKRLKEQEEWKIYQKYKNNK